MLDISIDEFKTLREEILFNLASIEKYLISTVIAYATFLFWSLNNAEVLYVEIFNIICYILIIISMNIISVKSHYCLKISGYISIILFLKNNIVNWETFTGRFNKRYSPNILGQPGMVLFFLGMVTYLFNALKSIKGMPKLFPNAYPYTIIIMFISFLFASIILLFSVNKTYKKTMNIWIDIAVEENLITKDEADKYISQYMCHMYHK